jgi:hypothetical protein
MGSTAERSQVFLTLSATSQEHLAAAHLLVLRDKLDSETDTAAALAALLRYLADEMLAGFKALDLEQLAEVTWAPASDRSRDSVRTSLAYDVISVEEKAEEFYLLACWVDSFTGPERGELCRRLEAGEGVTEALGQLSGYGQEFPGGDSDHTDDWPHGLGGGV